METETNFVKTNTGAILIQRDYPDGSFALESDDQAWTGGFGSGQKTWEIITDEQAKKELDRQLKEGEITEDYHDNLLLTKEETWVED